MKLNSVLTRRRIERYTPPTPPAAEPNPLPLYTGTFEADVLIPTAQASKLAGALSMPVAVAGVLLWGLESWPWWTALAATPVAYTALYAWATTRFIGHSRHRIETWQPTAAPEPPAQTVIEITSPDGRSRHNLHLGVSPTLLARFAAEAPKRGLGVHTWSGGGKSFTRRDYEAFTTRLMRAGLVTWRDPANRNLGLVFTNEGLGVMERLAGQQEEPRGRGRNVLDPEA